MIIIMRWQDLAACAGMDTDLFFPLENVRTHREKDRIAFAKGICSGCPVRADCLEYALDNDEQWGIYGEMTPAERSDARRTWDRDQLRSPWLWVIKE